MNNTAKVGDGVDFWCLENASTGALAQMPERGVLLCFGSFEDAKTYRRTIIAALKGWKVRRVSAADLAAYRGVSLWRASEPLGYSVATLQAAGPAASGPLPG